MLRRRYTLLTPLLTLLVSFAPRVGAQSLDSLLARMTLEEKLGQLNLLSAGGKTTPEQAALVRRGLVGGFLNVVGAGNTAAIQRVAVNESRLKIPLLFGLDVIHGFRTIFPMPLAEASTWDPEIAEATARAAGHEARAAGVNWTFAPMVDIARDPRWGRIAEGSGEDPYLGSLFAAARVRGFQPAVLATAKHFAAYGAAEAGRDYNTVDVSVRTLREIYLPPFKAAVDAGAASIMTAFNEIAGVPSSASLFLLDTVLRREWRFDGLVVSDWTSIAELIPHGVAGSRADAGRLALAAGLDMDMVSQIYVDSLPALVRAGRIPIAQVNRAVRHVLRAKQRLGLFDDPYRAAPAEPVNRALARRVAQQAIVLLKNERVLPLNPNLKTIAVIGPLAADTVHPLGPWHAQGQPGDVVSVLAAIRKRAGGGVTVLHAPGTGLTDGDTTGIAAATALARLADVAVLVVGETDTMSGEASSRAHLDLPGAQEQLVRTVQATGTPVVLVLMNGRPLVLSWAAEHVAAIVESWFLGIESGHAIADVLFGDVNPSGRLPVSFPRTVGQIPIYYNHKNTGRPPAATDRFTSKYLDVPVTPLYPFGYGLSYTSFSYDSLRLGAARMRRRGSLAVRVTVTNTGLREGVEVVQLYLRDEVASVTRPVRELKRFQRVSLEPGESRTISFVLTIKDLGLAEPGTFRVYAGPSSAEGLEASFVLAP